MTPNKGLPAPTVYLVDDDLAVRDSLSELIGSMSLAVRAYASGREFLEAYNPGDPGCLLLDLRMPQIGGLEVQRALSTSACSLPVIFITAHGDAATAVRAMKGGAIDFLQKPFNEQELWDCIQHAIHIDAANRRETLQNDEFNARMSRLTPGEIKVLDLLMNGLINKQIARQLDVSIRTVELRRVRILQKMEVDSLGALLAVVHRGRSRQLPHDPHLPAPTAVFQQHLSSPVS